MYGLCQCKHEYQNTTEYLKLKKFQSKIKVELTVMEVLFKAAR